MKPSRCDKSLTAPDVSARRSRRSLFPSFVFKMHFQVKSDKSTRNLWLKISCQWRINIFLENVIDGCWKPTGCGTRWRRIGSVAFSGWILSNSHRNRRRLVTDVSSVTYFFRCSFVLLQSLVAFFPLSLSLFSFCFSCRWQTTIALATAILVNGRPLAS